MYEDDYDDYEYDYDEDYDNYDEDYYDDYDEVGFAPYEGCYTYDC